MRKLTARAIPYQIPGYPDYLAALLFARGVKTQKEAELFLNPSIEQLHDPFLMSGMNNAVSLIKLAKEKGQVIAVYGDYDADGVCACAIMLEALQTFGVNAFAYIPSRQTEGYGINLDAVTALSKQAALLISVDCGITAVKEVKAARDLGMQVIITDHHTIPDVLPEADALVHPRLLHYPAPTLCGAGVAWKLACALNGLKASQGSLELAALATVADLVPLVGENRVIVALGLKEMSRTTRPGLIALRRVSGIKDEAQLSSDQIAYQLAPRLNAGGRLSTAQQALNLLTTINMDEAEQLAAELQALNQERREVEQQVLKEASAMLAGRDLSQVRSIVIAGEEWNPGVVGLTAGKLAERWNYPTIVLTRNGEEYSGSGRSAGKVDLHQALSDCAPLLSRFGGHKMAAGMAVHQDQLQEFISQFDQAVRNQLGEEDLIPETVYDTTLSLKEVSLATVEKLDLLAPFGLSNPSPVFLMEDLQVVSSRAVGAEQAHLKLTVAQNGAIREGIAFSLGKSQVVLSKEVSIVTAIDKNEFNGKSSAQLKVKAIVPGQTAYQEDLLLFTRSLISALEKEVEGEQEEVISSLPMPEGTRGTLFIAFTAQAANDLHRRFPDLSTFTGAATDPRSFNAIVFAPDFNRYFAPSSKLVFADGLPSVYTKVLAQKATGAAQVLALPKSPAFTSLLSELAPDLDELREVYRQLKAGNIAGFLSNLGKELVCLKIYEQLGLVELHENGTFKSLLPMSRIHPEESPLYRALK